MRSIILTRVSRIVRVAEQKLPTSWNACQESPRRRDPCFPSESCPTHDHRVLDRVRVIPPSDPNGLEVKLPIQALRRHVGGAHLQEPAGARHREVQVHGAQREGRGLVRDDLADPHQAARRAPQGQWPGPGRGGGRDAGFRFGCAGGVAQPVLGSARRGDALQPGWRSWAVGLVP